MSIPCPPARRGRGNRNLLAGIGLRHADDLGVPGTPSDRRRAPGDRVRTNRTQPRGENVMINNGARARLRPGTKAGCWLHGPGDARGPGGMDPGGFGPDSHRRHQCAARDGRHGPGFTHPPDARGRRLGPVVRGGPGRHHPDHRERVAAARAVSRLDRPDPGAERRLRRTRVLGLAFHPDYASNGRFFVRFSRPRTGVSGEPCFGTSRGCHEEVLAEFSVSGDPNVANPAGTILFAIDEPSSTTTPERSNSGPTATCTSPSATGAARMTG